ncbi:GNAT family N-acetyltransferase [Gloeocapsopsis dulcis]|uniref:N-acetyltransferase domain-containing protein n=1 Tax=Gloeocapsopsis dulcis AAB1 = 1H9 TaxID=1433147 RepID=A0A6N8FPU3_9CHRO|nr:GNAT family N-acetyltransferase [Gloeocapsopsis dulcis]MUL34904.1 hypothetical protein [Gloeocapsopsis dulcis AAB1 = 1H9]WNN90024.1 GNAT family N-acetyltransferase [Gloeocapsopsis dulcis]
MTTIRIANFEDIATIHAMTQAAYAEYRTILPHSSVWQKTPELIAAEMKLGSILLCVINGKIVASVRCHIKQGFVYVHRLAVLPAYRRQGLGSLLMQAVEELACELNLYQVRLELRVAQPENRHFYQKLGYKLGEISAYLPDGKPRSYWMSKKLTAVKN